MIDATLMLYIKFYSLVLLWCSLLYILLHDILVCIYVLFIILICVGPTYL